ncbi:MAG TPA: hypothetical protein DCM27_04280 [Rhodospirillaceae bacterium]|nr:hypothetical protein [Rhodospirillaceae bacterium]
MCNCKELPEWVAGDDGTEPFKSMSYILSVPDQYAIIVSCSDCKQNWWVNGSDKYSEGICVKIEPFDDIKDVNIEKFKYAKLIGKYGGLTDKKCMYQGCQNMGMKDIVFCPKCATEKNHIT